MPLSKIQEAWIQNVSGVAALTDRWEQNQLVRETALEEMAEQLDAMKDEIRSGASYELEPVRQKLLNRLVGRRVLNKSMHEDQDANKEVDAWADIPGTKPLPPEELKRIMDAHERITRRLRRSPVRNRVAVVESVAHRPSQADSDYGARKPVH